MADNAQLDTFLAAGTPPEGAEAPDPLIDPQGWAQTQKPPEATPEPPTKALEKPGEVKPAPEPEEDVAPHSGSDNRTVPFSALEKVRNDWKSKYAAEQARAELLAKQLDEAKKPPPPQAAPPQPVYQQPPPDPATDPYGYARHVMHLQGQQQLNHQLNTSEMLLREKIGDDKVTEYVNEFKELAARDQSLFPKLYSQPHPYAWMQREVERQRVLRDVGDDPTAFRAKVEAEARAKWEAELAQQPMNGGNGHAVSPAAGLAPSLANARSVAGRTTTTFTGPPPLEALFPGHNRRDQRRS
jgi:hypothetical protein